MYILLTRHASQNISKNLVVHLSQKLTRKVRVYVRLMCDNDYITKRTTMTLGSIDIQF